MRRARAKRRPRLLSAAACCVFGAVSAQAAEHTVIIAGLGGEPAYEKRFREQTAALADFARANSAADAVTVLTGADAKRDSVQRAFAALAQRVKAEDVVVVVLIGHGTFDGEHYRFNIPGPDLTGAELASLFDRLPARRQLIVNTTSASGAIVEEWARPERIVIAATKSGGERSATRFAQHWTQAMTTPAADVNRDDLVTAAEAFAHAQRQVEAAFKADASLATEHARMQGEDAGAFAVARFGAARAFAGDARVAALLSERGALELQLNDVKQQKAALEEEAYYDALEGVLVKIALLQRQIDARSGEGGGP